MLYKSSYGAIETIAHERCVGEDRINKAVGVKAAVARHAYGMHRPLEASHLPIKACDVAMVSQTACGNAWQVVGDDISKRQVGSGMIDKQVTGDGQARGLRPRRC